MFACKAFATRLREIKDKHEEGNHQASPFLITARASPLDLSRPKLQANLLGENALDQLAVHIGEAHLSASVLEHKSLMIDSQEMQ